MKSIWPIFSGKKRSDGQSTQRGVSKKTKQQPGPSKMGQSRQALCNMEKDLISGKTVDHPGMIKAIQSYTKAYNHFKNNKEVVQSMIVRSHVLLALTILCRFFESPGFQKEIQNTSMENWLFIHQGNLFAAALLLGARIIEDRPYNLDSYAYVFATNNRELSNMQSKILEYLDYNLMLTALTADNVWDQVLPHDVFPY